MYCINVARFRKQVFDLCRRKHTSARAASSSYCVSGKPGHSDIPTIPQAARLQGKTVELGILHINDLIAGTSTADDTHDRLNNNTLKIGIENRGNDITLGAVNEDSGFCKSDETNDTSWLG